MSALVSGCLSFLPNCTAVGPGCGQFRLKYLSKHFILIDLMLLDIENCRMYLCNAGYGCKYFLLFVIEMVFIKLK